MNDEPGRFLVRAVICEDEPLAVKAIREYLRDVDWIELVGEAGSGPEAIRLIRRLEPDLVFLDVRMPGATGLEVLDAISSSPAVVFTTAYDEYAIPAFDAGAADYLVKPFGRERFLKTLGRVRVRIVGEGLVRDDRPAARRERYAARLFARRHGSVVPLQVSQISRIDAAPGGASLVTRHGRFELDLSLGELQERLDPDEFVRVHRSHLINLAHVASLQPFDERRLLVTMRDDSEVIASRRGSQQLRRLMG
jgi:two-component system LytT family response regulator